MANKITEKGDLVLWSHCERSQIQNKEQVIRRLQELVNQALFPQKPRLKTRPIRSSKEKRLQTKKIISQKKQFRRAVDY